MRGFFTDRDSAASSLSQWDAFKGYLRGLLIAEITQVKRHSSGMREELESQVQVLEEQYVQDPFDSARVV